MSGAEPDTEPLPRAKGKSRSKAKAKAEPAVAAAAAELSQATGGPGTSPPPAPQVEGPFPAAASSTGRAYYLFSNSDPPFIAAGQAVALQELGGSWLGHARGRCPKGFATLVDALNHADHLGFRSISIRWA